MKLFIGLLFATLAFNGVLSLPARNPSDDAEVIGGPRRVSTTRDDDADDDDAFTNFKGVVDTGSGYPFLQPNPSVIRVGFFDSFDDLFRRFSARLFPSTLFGGRVDVDDSDEADSGEVGFPKFDTKKANSTSTVKVVDGHKVEVNETVYGDENSVFKVRVVNIRPLEDGETVEETVNTNKNSDDGDNIKPVTSAPDTKNPNAETDDSDERREPLEKKPTENEIQGNIDDPEQVTIANNENIVETTTATETTTTPIDTDNTMLPTTEDINAAFVTDNSLEQEEQQETAAAAAIAAAEELNANENNNGNGNNEFETNMSEDNDDNNSNSNSDNVDNVENPEVEHTIENNEDTEEEINDNLNESSLSSSINANEGVKEEPEEDNNDNNKESEAENDDDEDDVAEDIEIINSNIKHSNYAAAIRNKEREDESSSDDEDTAAANVEMHPTFNDEWGSFSNEQQQLTNNENNDFSNDIDVYDVEPIDLSNDIAVNDAPNLPINPDAEFIDVFGVQHQSNTMPKFEKLSLDYPPSPAPAETSTASEEDWSYTPSK